MMKRPRQDAEIPHDEPDRMETRNSDPGSTDTPPPPPSVPACPTQLEVATYIEDISLELASLARRNRLKSLGYFIDMVRLEASTLRLSLLTPGRGEAGSQRRDISPPG